MSQAFDVAVTEIFKIFIGVSEIYQREKEGSQPTVFHCTGVTQSKSALASGQCVSRENCFSEMSQKKKRVQR